MLTDHTKETFEAPPDKLHYAAWQLEKCPETGKLHVQAYIVFTQDRTFNTMKKLYPGAHIEKARSSDAACYKYVTKEDTRVAGPFYHGERPKVTEEDRKSDYMKLVAYTEGSVVVTDIIRRIIRWYFEQQRCEPPEIRIKTLATSIMMHNTYKADPNAYSALENARARRIAYTIENHPYDYLRPHPQSSSNDDDTDDL